MPTLPSTSPRADLTLDLPGGRTLAYAEWGDPAGKPVLRCTSRLFDPGPDATAGVRLITADRPGFGGTDPVAEPSFSAAAEDLAFDVVAGARGDRLPLEAVNAPTRLWYGAADEYIKLEHARWYSERIPGSRLEESRALTTSCRSSGGGRSSPS
jgi:pimeloyl-ACP methyl ester carboxylesterase